MSNTLDLIIFDCDGVLVDSEIIGIQLTVSLLNQQGVDIDVGKFTRLYSGLAWEALIEQVRRDTGITLSATIGQHFYPQLMAAFATRLKRIDGSLEVISNITTPKCICSNSGCEQLDYMLTLVGLKSLFAPDIYSAMDLGPGRGKPEPDIFLHGAQQFNAQPANTLVIEDSVHGVMAAKRAGMYVVGFTGGAHTTPDHQSRLMTAGADVVIDSLYRLPEEIERFQQLK
ncbi:HAD family phosphatase [Klebsiella sp. BIGb0407]|uniref:HAD family hydrolase n=1 Tax=Klebsiella sp. BIGb0407 TaxID=2940603 RepID=UPI00216A15BD|nr:HAD family hydrolase [Klebsiella sp. BIGb0407]MCS3430999.1 HAD superfamily hydrolase (TIGR01509 family) [Klebsiella sp. BIGb0407]